MLWLPAVSVVVEQEAVRVLLLPTSATAAQAESEVPASVKLTLPVGLVPVTAAVKVTMDPTADGLVELESVVVVAVPPPVVTLTVTALALAPVTMMFTPVVLSR
jgi:hypothetical protein